MAFTCRDGYLPDGVGSVNLAGSWSPGNAGTAPSGERTDSRPRQSAQTCPPLKVRSGRIIFRPNVRIIIGWGRTGFYQRSDPVGMHMGKPQMDNDVRAGSQEEALDTLSDEELVIAHLRGRNGAFEDLYDRYRDRLVHFVTRKTGDGDQAQDLVQEAFIRVTRHLHRFDTSKKFSTWVYTIASNLSKNELRNRSRSPLVLFQRLTNSWDDDHRPIQFEDFRMRPDDLYRKRYLKRLVEDTVQELPEHHRLVFQLRELEGKSYEEISEITGVNLGTVKSRLHRARNSFAQRIEPFLN